jgi:hypothetical protein
MKTLRYTVEGRCAFPIDMLRYDCCWPATEQDANQIESINDPMVDSREDKPYQITVETARNTRDHGRFIVTEGRWDSFNWKLVEGPHA